MPQPTRSRLLGLPPVDQPVQVATLGEARAVLEAHRMAQRLGERELAVRAGYNKGVYYNFTHGVSVPTLAAFLHFNLALGCRLFIAPKDFAFRNDTQK